MNDEHDDDFEMLAIDSLVEASGGRIAILGPDGREAPMCPSPYTENDYLQNGSSRRVMWSDPSCTVRTPPTRPPTTTTTPDRPLRRDRGR